jgi:hypothetical protein
MAWNAITFDATHDILLASASNPIYILFAMPAIWIDAAVTVIIMFAYIIRAMIIRASLQTAIIFVIVLVSTTSIMYVIALFIDIDLLGVIVYSISLGAVTFAADVFPRKTAPFLIEPIVDD